MVGNAVGSLTGTAASGETIDTCDRIGVPYVIDLSAMWCGPCQRMSGCLAGDDMDCDALALGATATSLREMLAMGMATWLTILLEDEAGLPATVENVIAWDAAFPAVGVTTMTDEANALGKINPFSLPTLHVVDHAGDWFVLDDYTSYAQLEALVATYGN